MEKIDTKFSGYYNYTGKTKTQRIATGISSMTIGGLGQVINGDTSKGIAFFLGTLLNIACFIARGYKNKIAHIIVGLLI